MADTWPVSLPQRLLFDSFAEQLADGLLQSQTDTGPPKTRLRSTAMARPLAGWMKFKRTQVATLRTFVTTTLLGGSLPFNFPAQSEAGTYLVKFVQGSLPKISMLGGGAYRVDLNLLVLP